LVVFDGKLRTVKVVWYPDDSALSSMVPRYASEQFSYSEVGATQRECLPGGYHHVNRTFVLGADERAFERAAEALMTWAMHRRSGLVVAASAERAQVDVTTVMAFGPFFAGVVIPCRVVWTVVERDRQGFAYGTLPGHPERGEEAFFVEHVRGSVTFTIRAFSKPGDKLVRAGSRISQFVQGQVTNRYGRSLAEIVRV
jgi:uncharacterized protein (UPF0548 family)